MNCKVWWEMATTPIIPVDMAIKKKKKKKTKKKKKKTVGKGEIARNEQFLLFPQCFLPVWRTSYHFHRI